MFSSAQIHRVLWVSGSVAQRVPEEWALGWHQRTHRHAVVQPWRGHQVPAGGACAIGDGALAAGQGDVLHDEALHVWDWRARPSRARARGGREAWARQRDGMGDGRRPHAQACSSVQRLACGATPTRPLSTVLFCLYPLVCLYYSCFVFATTLGCWVCSGLPCVGELFRCACT
eukprot:SAG11_NODE_4431_length_1897_cov_2.688543_2_plen_173_part_00